MFPFAPIETLEPRYSPARLIAGPLPAEFGATLDPAAQGEIVEELPPEIVIMEIPGQIAPSLGQVLIGNPMEYYGGTFLGGSISLTNRHDGLIKSAVGQLNTQIQILNARMDFAELVLVSQVQIAPELSNTNGAIADLSVPLLSNGFSGGHLLVGDSGISLGSGALLSLAPGFSGGSLSGSVSVISGGFSLVSSSTLSTFSGGTVLLSGANLVSGGTLNLSNYAGLIEGIATREIPLPIEPDFEPEPEPVAVPLPE